MPVILQLDFGGVTISMYFEDHNPPHVHARGPDAEAVIDLRTISVLHAHGFSSRMLSRIQRAVHANRQHLLDLWEDYHE